MRYISLSYCEQIKSFKHIFLIVTLLITLNGMAADFVDATYIANDGYLFSDGTEKVLIDGIFYLDGSKWHSPDKKLCENMLNGEKPFDNIDALIFTHDHRDHYSKDLVTQYLSSFSSTLIAPPQVIDNLSTTGKGTILAAPANFYQSSEFKVGKMKITALTLHHVGGNKSTQNTVILVDLAGITILHAGDAALEDLYSADFPETDIVMLSYWQGFDNETMRKINQNIKSKHVIFKHAPFETVEETAQKIKANYGTVSTDYSLFTDTFETVRYTKENNRIIAQVSNDAYSDDN